MSIIHLLTAVVLGSLLTWFFSSLTKFGKKKKTELKIEIASSNMVMIHKDIVSALYKMKITRVDETISDSVILIIKGESGRKILTRLVDGEISLSTIKKISKRLKNKPFTTENFKEAFNKIFYRKIEMT